MNDTPMPKHARLFASLRQDLRDGRWRPGERMPGEAELVERFGVSRITVSRAMRDLKAAGLVERRPGSGTYVRDRRAEHARSFGLLIPDLGESEIFEPICRAMMASRLADRHALLWGNTCSDAAGDARADRGERAWHLCRQYLERDVAGVFFAPLEYLPARDELNRKILCALEDARIPVVLLDRPVEPFPACGRHDLVGIDNRRAGYVVTEHLLGLGCRRLHFAAFAGAAATVEVREAGFREALHARDIAFERSFAHRLEADDDAAVAALMREQRPDGIVCANDRIAGALMHSLLKQGFAIPGDVRLVGIDDVEYARLLPVPLTTLKQPTADLGVTALATMLQRIAHPELPARDIRLSCGLTVRASCGGCG